MPHAGMLAYVIGPEAADPCTSLPAIWSTQAGHAAQYAPIEPISGEGGVPAIALSRHARTFLLRNGEAPGQILLRHLWLHFPLERVMHFLSRPQSNGDGETQTVSERRE